MAFDLKKWESMIVVLSAMYCKLLVVFGLALPMSEFISADIPPLFFHGFYLYLYGMSVAFLLFVYTFLLRDSVNTNELGSSSHLNKWNTIKVSRSLGRILRLDTVTSRSEADLETGSQISRTPQRRPYMVFVANYGSFYLRSGAVLFGIGSMIYSGLEIGQYFDVSHACQSVVMVATPALKLIFTFIQMYFVFLNASMSINKHKVLGRFGLMHMVATNLCTWLNVVIEETKHELDHLLGKHSNELDSHARNDVISGHVMTHTPSTNEHSSWHGHDNVSLAANVSFFNGLHDSASESNITSTDAPTTPLALMAVDCGRDSIMGKLVNSVSPFLFPCSIEYSLICAATLYVMWKHLNKLNTLYVQRDVNGDRARKHHYSVDCASASKGLFLGILVFVATVISLILFFVLINNPSSRQLAIHSASATEIILYTLTSMAILIGILQVQKLTYHPNRNMELDNILLVAAQSGVFLYAVFNIIGAYFMSDAASLATGVMSIIQVTLQTMFILDTSHRQVFTSNQVVQKPGREVVTFLLISNLAMWATNTFETSRSDAHPEQLHFYGFWAWTVISHVSMPLAIFYRFHCTVCLCEIWKRAYKQKTIA